MAESQPIPLDALRLAEAFEQQAQGLVHVAAVLKSARTAESVVAEAQGRKSAVEEQIARLHQQLVDSRDQVEASHGAVTAAKKELAKLGAAVTTATAELDHARVELAGLERGMLGAQQARDVAERDRAALAAQVDAKSAELVELTADGVARLDSIEAETAQAEARLAAAKAAHESFLRQVTGAPA